MTDGFAALTGWEPRPSRSATPGRKFSTTTSARRASSNARRAPSGCWRSTAIPRLFRLIAANVALMPSPRHARRSSPRPGRSTLMTSAPRSAMSVAQYGPAMTRERSRTWIPSSIVQVRATVEEALRRRVDLGDARAGDGVDPRLGFRQRPRGLGGQQLDPGARLFEERRARHDAVDEAHRMGVGGRIPPALHDDLFGARGPDEADEARRGGDTERHAEVDLRDPELRLLRGPAEVAGERQPPAAPDRVAVDHRERRLLEALEQRVRALEEAAELALPLRERPPPLVDGHLRVERGIGAGAEDGRRARDDQDAGGGVVSQLGERRPELGQHRVAQRVAPVGMIQRDGRDRALTREGDAVAHDARTVTHRRRPTQRRSQTESPPAREPARVSLAASPRADTRCGRPRNSRSGPPAVSGRRPSSLRS